jgi:hypothetical protein
VIPAQRGPGEDVLKEDAAAGGIFVSGPRGEQPCCSAESSGSRPAQKAPAAQPTAGCVPVRREVLGGFQAPFLSRRSPEMSSKTASGAQGERQLTVPLRDDLDPSHYKLMSAAQDQLAWMGRP